jgi:hypothetical protein
MAHSLGSSLLIRENARVIRGSDQKGAEAYVVMQDPAGRTIFLKRDKEWNFTQIPAVKDGAGYKLEDGTSITANATGLLINGEVTRKSQLWLSEAQKLTRGEYTAAAPTNPPPAAPAEAAPAAPPVAPPPTAESAQSFPVRPTPEIISAPLTPPPAAQAPPPDRPIIGYGRSGTVFYDDSPTSPVLPEVAPAQASGPIAAAHAARIRDNQIDADNVANNATVPNFLRAMYSSSLRVAAAPVVVAVAAAPPPPPPPAAAEPEAAKPSRAEDIMAMSKEDRVKAVQQMLSDIGIKDHMKSKYENGGIDGIAGKDTNRSVIQFQTRMGMTPGGVSNGDIDAKTVAALVERHEMTMGQTPAAHSRPTAGFNTVAAQPIDPANEPSYEHRPEIRRQPAVSAGM